MSTQPLTERQRQVLSYIEQYTSEHGYPPTYQELRQQLGYTSLNAVGDVLRALERKGYIRRLPGRSRTISLNRTPAVEHAATQAQKLDTVPIIGTATADNLLSAFLRPRGLVRVDSSFFDVRDMEFFAAIVECDDLHDDGIRRGDVILVLPNERPANGSVVLCFTSTGQQILRRYSQLRNGTIELCAARRNIPVMRLTPDDQSFRIVGVVRGLLRRY